MPLLLSKKSLILCKAKSKMNDEVLESANVELMIIEERNKEVNELHDELERIADIQLSLSAAVSEQGDTIESVSTTVNEVECLISGAEEYLEVAELTEKDNRWLAFDIGTIITLPAVGSLGFIGGVTIGIPCLIGGFLVAASVVIVRRIK